MELPDWLRGIALLGYDGLDYRVLVVNAGGQLEVLIVGKDSEGNFRVLRTDDAGRLIMQLRGRDGNQLVVDSSGFMTTVIKGYDGAALRTVKVDSDGHLSAFVIDSTDAWGRMLQVGNAELAARLGSPVVYEQRGRVAMMESFEYGMQRWQFVGLGTGSSAAIDPTLCVTGGYSVRLTGGSDGAMGALIEWSGGCLTTTRVGVEMSFSFRDPVDKCDIRVTVWDGTTRHSGALRLDQTNADLYVRTGETTWTKVADVFVRTETEWIFNRLKVVVDLSTGLYVRGYLDNQEFDLSAYSIWTGADAIAPRAVVSVYMYSEAGENRTMNVDDIILTVAEPA